MGNFLAATAVVPRLATAGPHEFDVHLDDQWGFGTKLNGGYLLAVLGRAAAEVSGAGHPHLTAISGSFITSPRPGPAVAEVDLLRAGNGSTQVRARLRQGDQPCVEALITQGLLTDADSWWSGPGPVDLPPEHECVRSPADGPGAGFRLSLMDVVEQRLDPSLLGFAMGDPSGKGTIAGWHRLADGTDWDPLSLLVALDAMPPVSYDLGIPGWAPTVQFSAYMRRLPAPGPVRVRTHATDVGGDRMDEATFAWDSKDRLVAQATQIAEVRVPDRPAHS